MIQLKTEVKDFTVLMSYKVNTQHVPRSRFSLFINIGVVSSDMCMNASVNVYVSVLDVRYQMQPIFIWITGGAVVSVHASPKETVIHIPDYHPHHPQTLISSSLSKSLQVLF